MDYRLLAACLVIFVALPWLGERLLRRWGHLQTNFRGVAIPQSFGAVVLLQAFLLFCLLAMLWPQQRQQFLSWGLLCVVFGLLGLADDLWGTPDFRGFRGHLRALFQNGKLTTGLLKAVGGGLFALGFSYENFAPNWPRVVLGGLVIALSANAINLLDLRPGRAIAVFLVVALPLLLQITKPLHHPLFFLMLCAASLWPYDARRCWQQPPRSGRGVRLCRNPLVRGACGKPAPALCLSRAYRARFPLEADRKKPHSAFPRSPHGPTLSTYPS